MAIRVGNPGQNAAPRGPDAAAGQLSQDLQKAGFGASTNVQLLSGLLGALTGKGFAGQGAALGDRLTSSLKQFQAALGLPVTGRLDAKTLAALQKLGLLGKPGGARGVADGFEGAAAGKSAAGALSTSQDASAAQPTLKTVLAGLAQAAQSGAQGASQALSALLAQQVPAGPQDGGGAKTADASGQAHARADGAPAQSVVAGLSQGLANPGAVVGQAQAQPGQDGGAEPQDVSDPEKARQGRGGDDGEEQSDDDTGNPDGEGALSVDEQGNAQSGDANLWDRRRGHASLDEDMSAPPGHYRVPTYRGQVLAALGSIHKDGESERAQVTTYSWDVMLFKPGVYGRGQPAPEVLHLEVRRADAFDAAWSTAVEGVNRLLDLHEPDAQRVGIDHIQAALRRARVRD